MVVRTNSTLEDQPWFTNNGPNAHITRDLENLSIQPEPFQGPESMAVGNGAGLTIEHTSSTIFHSSSIPFTLSMYYFVLLPQLIYYLSKKFAKIIIVTSFLHLLISW